VVNNAVVAVAGSEAPKVNLVNFNIKTTYKPSQAPGGPNANPAQPAAATATAPAPAQPQPVKK
jgi:hypothetical protein